MQLEEVKIFDEYPIGQYRRYMSIELKSLSPVLAEMKFIKMDTNRSDEFELYVTDYVEDMRQVGWLVVRNSLPNAKEILDMYTRSDAAFELNHPKYSHVIASMHSPELAVEAISYLGLKLSDIKYRKALSDRFDKALLAKKLSNKINKDNFKPVIKKLKDFGDKIIYGAYPDNSEDILLLKILVLHKEDTDESTVGYVPNRVHYPDGMNPLFRGKGLFPKIMFEVAKQCRMITSGGPDRSEAATHGWGKMDNFGDFEKVSKGDWDFLIYKKAPDYKELRAIADKLFD